MAIPVTFKTGFRDPEGILRKAFSFQPIPGPSEQLRFPFFLHLELPHGIETQQTNK